MVLINMTQAGVQESVSFISAFTTYCRLGRFCNWRNDPHLSNYLTLVPSNGFPCSRLLDLESEVVFCEERLKRFLFMLNEV